MHVAVERGSIIILTGDWCASTDALNCLPHFFLLCRNPRPPSLAYAAVPHAAQVGMAGLDAPCLAMLVAANCPSPTLLLPRWLCRMGVASGRLTWRPALGGNFGHAHCAARCRHLLAHFSCSLQAALQAAAPHPRLRPRLHPQLTPRWVNQALNECACLLDSEWQPAGPLQLPGPSCRIMLGLVAGTELMLHPYAQVHGHPAVVSSSSMSSSAVDALRTCECPLPPPSSNCTQSHSPPASSDNDEGLDAWNNPPVPAQVRTYLLLTGKASRPLCHALL